jgi:hypothetical protein
LIWLLLKRKIIFDYNNVSLMAIFNSVYIFAVPLVLLFSCNTIEKYKSDLNKKNHPSLICNAAYELGEARDASAIKPLLNNILDVRMSTNLNFKGMTVCYCKLRALKKILWVEPPFKINQFDLDSAAVKYYLDLVIKKGLINAREVNINYTE